MKLELTKEEVLELHNQLRGYKEMNFEIEKSVRNKLNDLLKGESK